MTPKEIVREHIEKLNQLIEKEERAYGEIIFQNGQCQLLAQSAARFEIIVDDEFTGESMEFALDMENDGTIIPIRAGEAGGWDRYAYACLLQIQSELHLLDPKEHIQHKKYTRKGMIARVLKERMQKAEKAQYRIKWADNIFGDHILTNERGVKYKIFLRDFKQETGYSDSMDSRLNKLGTTKHIMFAFNELKTNRQLYQKLSKVFPFVEVFCNPLNDYKITWHYPQKLQEREQTLLNKYFKDSNFVEDDNLFQLLDFIEEAADYPRIMIRPEVNQKIEAAFEARLLNDLRLRQKLNFGSLKAQLYNYQNEGIEFASFRKNAIIADEMGLGKTIQAIGTALMKKDIFGFSKTLVVCPASLKEQWKKEIEKFTDEQALVISGLPVSRAKQYLQDEYFFFIINYETVVRDYKAINKAGFDFIILDEIQRAKNYETKTASSLRLINARHKLAITGTPIENRLIDIYSIMGILDPEFFGPLWEFSYQHCLFDPDKHNKINGYYNLQQLNSKLDEILIRREKRKVIDQLPNLMQINIPVELSPLQSDLHASYAKGVASIIRKKFITPYDLQRLQLLLANMRMVCDSTYLIDDKTNESPKLEELEHILLHKLDVKNRDVKIIIFSEWVKVHKLIGKLLRDNFIGFVELNGKIPVKSRGELIRKFEENPQYKVFLSTEAGGTGLNLQIADTLINFELPWNPAKKNQRIGRIDRIGQRSNKLTIYNFITKKSIEEQIASGLLVKQSLFDGVLNEGSGLDFVDFSSKGRSQFIEQLEQFINSTEEQQKVEEQGQLLLPLEEETPVIQLKPLLPADEIDPEVDESDTTDAIEEEAPAPTEPVRAATPQPEELQQVMNSGLQFLSGLFKMTTGKEMGMENQTIEVNKETGEVTIRFKMPGM